MLSTHFTNAASLKETKGNSLDCEKYVLFFHKKVWTKVGGKATKGITKTR